MNSGELWRKLSEPSDKSSTTLKLVESTKSVSGSKQEIEYLDIAKIMDKTLNVMKVDSPDLNTTDTLESASRVREVHQQDISTIHKYHNIYRWGTLDPLSNPLSVINSRHKQNYDNFRERYMGILDDVKNEAEHARSLDSDIEEIKNEAYDEFAVVMEEIYNAGISMPEVTWNEDGSFDICWPLKIGGTSTILVYGDGHVIYNTYLGQNNYVESICKISDGLLLPKLIGILSNITE